MRKTVLLFIVLMLLSLAAGSLFLLRNGRGGSPVEAQNPVEPAAAGEMDAALASEAAGQFMKALKTGDYPRAYALCTPALQGSFEDLEGFSTFIVENGLQLQGWSWTGQAGEGEQAYFNGTVAFKDGRAGSVSLDLEQVDTGWQVSDLIMRPEY